MLNIIPEPAKVVRRQGAFHFGAHLMIYAGRSQRRAVRRLIQFACDNLHVALKTKEIQNDDNILLIADRFEITPRPLFEKPESYTLDIGDAILICGADQAGVFYGVMTLIQMLEDSATLPKLRVEDQPAMGMRAEHWDLKGLMPKFSYLKKRIGELSKYKINTLLIEYEDKFSFERHPAIVSGIALSKRQVAEIVKIANENFIEVIPLVQSLGHAEYVLRHPAYSHVAESRLSCQQYCASSNATLALFRDFVEEIAAIHPSKYIHVGGDEAGHLGECVKCASLVRKKGRMGLYFDYICKICEYILSIGKTPMIWDDMLCRNFRVDLLKRLPAGTVVVPWLYGIGSEREIIFCGPNHSFPFSRRWLHKMYKPNIEMLSFFYNGLSDLANAGLSSCYEQIPQPVKRKIRKYVEIEGAPKYFNSAPSVSLIEEAGLNFVGAGAALASSDGRFLPNSEMRIANLKTWSKIVAKHGGLGVIATEWARSGTLTEPNSPFEVRWHAVLAMAEHSWTGGRTDDKLFDRKFCWRLFGLCDLQLTDALYFLRASGDRFAPLALNILENLNSSVKRNLQTYEALLNAAALLCLDIHFNQTWTRYFLPLFYKIKEGTLHESQKADMEKCLEEMHSKLHKHEQLARRILLKTMPKQEVEEYLKCIFIPKLQMNNYIKNLLNSN